MIEATFGPQHSSNRVTHLPLPAILDPFSKVSQQVNSDGPSSWKI